MINTFKDFTFAAYAELLGYLKQKYRIIPFCKVSRTEEPLLILRHDVDASLDAALKMARMEKSFGISSTYFVLFSHKLYNLLEKDSLATLRNISGLGHEIGLHYDVETYESYEKSLQDTLKTEIGLLGDLLHKKVFSIACHNVSLRNAEDPFKNIKEYLNAYDSEYCQNYVSDSCRAWHLDSLSELLSLKPTRVQLLIHPILWTEEICARDDIYKKLFAEVEHKNTKYREKWLKLLHENPKVKAYDEKIEKLGHARQRVTH
jgi:hypothetical protein